MSRDLDGSDDINKHWNNIKSSLQTAAEKILGEPKKQNKPWIGHETFALIDKRSRARAKLSKAKLRREIKYGARKKHGTTPSSQTKSSPRMKVGHSQNVLSRQEALRHRSDFHRYTQRRTWTQYHRRKKIETWANHFQNLLNIPSANGVPIAPTAGPLSCVSSDPPFYDEILLALNKLKNNKAGGIDGLPSELFRRGAPSVCQPLQELFALIWLHQKIPDDWNIAVIISCYKKGGKAKCSNYRGINLIAIALKVLEAVIKNRLEPAYTKAARINQAGFKKGVGCRDQVFTLRQKLEQRYQFSRWTVIFIDFKAAFNSINREAIWTILSNLGLDPIISNILRTMHAKTTSKVRVNNTLSREFEIANGVRQGSIIAPFLFQPGA